jgi:hypothetical protein
MMAQAMETTAQMGPMSLKDLELQKKLEIIRLPRARTPYEIQQTGESKESSIETAVAEKRDRDEVVRLLNEQYAARANAVKAEQAAKDAAAALATRQAAGQVAGRSAKDQLDNAKAIQASAAAIENLRRVELQQDMTPENWVELTQRVREAAENTIQANRDVIDAEVDVVLKSELNENIKTRAVEKGARDRAAARRDHGGPPSRRQRAKARQHHDPSVTGSGCDGHPRRGGTDNVVSPHLP